MIKEGLASVGRIRRHPLKAWKEELVYPDLPNWSIQFAEGRAEKFLSAALLPEAHRKKCSGADKESSTFPKMVTSLCFSESFFECRSLNHKRREQRRWSRNGWYPR